MPRPRDSRFYGATASEPVVRVLDADREKADRRRRRRLEREVFESATRNLDRPLLRPQTGTPLRPDAPATPVPHAPNNSGGPIVLPPATFTDDEMDTF